MTSDKPIEDPIKNMMREEEKRKKVWGLLASDQYSSALDSETFVKSIKSHINLVNHRILKSSTQNY